MKENIEMTYWVDLLEECHLTKGKTLQIVITK